MTFDLFRDEVNHAKNPNVVDQDAEKNPKHITIDEVVRTRQMHYYRVPRLGSYLAIKLEYNSCLFDEAFENAIADYSAIKK